MKLTKLQRYTAYCLMLEEAQSPSYFIFKNEVDSRLSTDCGLCRLFKVLFDSGDFYNSPQETLPELYNKMPNTSSVWFPQDKHGWQQRIALLKQCIIETHPNH